MPGFLMAGGYKPWISIFIFWITMEMMNVSVSKRIPTTLQGPFEPVTVRFDRSLRRGSDDLPMDHPRLRKKVASIFPQQIALAVSSPPTSMWVSWVTGDAQIGANVTPLDPGSVSSEVWCGKQSRKYTIRRSGVSTVYSQLYPFEGLHNYTSGIIHHVKLEGLESGTKYFYMVGDSSFPAMSEEHSFETLPFPGPKLYPAKIAIVGDLGLTSNSTTTFDHLIKNDPSMVLMVGDLAYANQYLTIGGKGAASYSHTFPDSPIRETYQPRWDAWGSVMYFQVHAYERTNRVYNYTLDPCGPVYITVGDGGNIEKVDVEHADDPGKCPSVKDNVPEYGGVCHLNFSVRPWKSEFCLHNQPEWSAFRESSFGHGILEVVNYTHALWSWHRNLNAYKKSSKGDQIFIVRTPHLC